MAVGAVRVGAQLANSTGPDREVLGEQVQAWAEHPLEEKYSFLLADAMRLNVQRQGAVRSTQALIVVSISEEGC